MHRAAIFGLLVIMPLSVIYGTTTGIIKDDITLRNDSGETRQFFRGEQVVILQENDWFGKESPDKTYVVEVDQIEYEIHNKNLYCLLLRTSSVNVTIQKKALYAKDNYYDYHILDFLDHEGNIVKEIELDYRVDKHSFVATLIREADIEDANRDNDNEIIICSEYYGGYYQGDGFRYEVVDWFSIEADNIKHMFSYYKKGGGSIISEYILDSTIILHDLDHDDFMETIKLERRSTIDNDPEVIESFIYYSFRRDAYVMSRKFPVKGILNDSNVRLRTEPNLSCRTITHLNKDEEVTIMDMTPKKERIGDAEFHWYKVKKKDNTIGWSFGQFIDIEKSQ